MGKRTTQLTVLIALKQPDAGDRLSLVLAGFDPPFATALSGFKALSSSDCLL